MQPSQLLSMKDVGKGRIFVMGNGPSLIDQVPQLKKMPAEIFFGCNSLFFWEDLPVTPRYYGITDVYEKQYIDKLASILPRHVWAFNLQWPGGYNHERFIPVEKAHDSIQVRSSGSVGLGAHLPPIPTARTTPLTLVQLAFWFGYRDIYLLGVEQTRGYCHNPEATETMRGHAMPHDHNIKYKMAIIGCAEQLRKDVEAVGGHLYDCSPGGVLNPTGKGLHPGLPVAYQTPPLEYKELEEVCGKD